MLNSDDYEIVEKYRAGADWIIPATAAGIPDAVSIILHAISRDSLHKRDVSSYHYFDAMIDAIAAYKVQLVREVAVSWVRPDERELSNWELRAWRMALHYLYPSLPIDREIFSKSTTLANELKFLDMLSTGAGLSWSDAAIGLKTDPQSRICFLERIVTSRLLGPLPSIEEVHSAPAGMVFLLMTRASELPNDMQTYLFGTAEILLQRYISARGQGGVNMRNCGTSELSSLRSILENGTDFSEIECVLELVRESMLGQFQHLRRIFLASFDKIVDWREFHQVPLLFLTDWKSR